MNEIKLIITGSMGAGKTTLVTAMSDFPPAQTEVALPASQFRGTKTTTTVAMDYGATTLEDGRKLLIFGTPGQRRFDFMCKILARGALGVVILIDHASDSAEDDLAYYLDLFRDTINEAGAVIGVTHTDERPNGSMNGYYEILASRALVLPVFRVDARRKDHIMTMLEALVATVA
ncbi:MAG TPA: ATP/GTP-binding protein [Acetobacteraceae bacterium]|nr:ATP/GTP-binding protein [Acetobacteraceae bacterium]